MRNLFGSRSSGDRPNIHVYRCVRRPASSNHMGESSEVKTSISFILVIMAYNYLKIFRKGFLIKVQRHYAYTALVALPESPKPWFSPLAKALVHCAIVTEL